MLFEKCWRDKYLEGLNDAKGIPRLCSTPRADISSSIERLTQGSPTIYGLGWLFISSNSCASTGA